MPEAAVSTQITVRYCNPQQTGKKNASVKSDDGQLYFVAPEMFPQFEQGGRYNIQYRVSAIRGVQYRFIEAVTKAAGAAGPNPMAAHNSGTKATYGHVDMETAERIFVCGALNAMLSNQNTLPFSLLTGDIVTRVNILREVWRQTLGNPQQSAELQDEIPFA